VVICVDRGADLHTTQLMPLPLTVSCFSKIQIGFTFLVPAHPGSPVQRAVKRVCVCVCCNIKDFNKQTFVLSVFLTVQKDSSGSVVLLFCIATCSRCFPCICTTRCLHGSRSSGYRFPSIAVCGCIFLPATQGTSVYYLRFSDVEHCCGCGLSSLVSVMQCV